MLFGDTGRRDASRSVPEGRRFDFELIGTGRAALELLGRGGRALVLGWSSGQPTTVDGSDVVGRGITVAPAFGPDLLSRVGGVRELEQRALAAAARGDLVPVVSATFPLARAADAHQALESRATIGKVVLKP
ncbi:zinc-binding dehydrogenase [Haloechinothrix halophila]|uniref:zinc-binding dehydrogenase n=1 Tax=Haloechinothrix halophila TaxID=1069073 RepID=UPI00041681AA|nr:zinc-binding dehydrogenase [Haloechinothrix halophila]